MSQPQISVLIPAYNEEAALPNVIIGALTVLDAIGQPYELLVVDDGSEDKTAEVAELLEPLS